MASLSSSALLQVSATTSAYPLVVPLRYLGSDPVAVTNNIATKQFADNYFQNNSLVTANWIDNQVDAARSNLITTMAMNSAIGALDSSGNRVYPTVAQLKTILGAYAESSQLGVASGIAKANSSGVLNFNDSPNLIPSNIPADNVIKYYNCLTDSSSLVYLTSSVAVGTSTLPTAYTAATFTIPDPGYPYYPMNFVYIQGKSAGTVTTRTQNTTQVNIGRILVAAPPSPGSSSLPTSWFALGECTSDPYQNWYAALPYVNAWTSTSLPVMPVAGTTALTGSLTLNLYLSNASGTGYTFYSSGFTWFVMVVPAANMTLYNGT